MRQSCDQLCGWPWHMREAWGWIFDGDFVRGSCLLSNMHKSMINVVVMTEQKKKVEGFAVRSSYTPGNPSLLLAEVHPDPGNDYEFVLLHALHSPFGLVRFNFVTPFPFVAATQWLYIWHSIVCMHNRQR